MPRESYTLQLPLTRSTSVIFASPHSGSDYSEEFLRRAHLDRLQIRTSEDAFVDRLFATATGHGAPLLSAQVPRAYVDLNRGPDELDPALIDGLDRKAANPRVASGLGVIPRVVANGRHIYHGKISLQEARQRVSRHWRPYHDQIQMLVDQSVTRFGESILIDCHSMPHEALENIGAVNGQRPDVVLGDRFGASAGREVVERIEAAFAAAGFRVSRNMPFAGAYVAQTYGRPAHGRHAVQIEIDRSLYMDEARIEERPDFEEFRRALDGVIADIAAIGRPASTQLAAE